MSTKDNPIEQQLAVVKPESNGLVVAERDRAALAAIFGNLVGRELHNFTGNPRDLWAFKALCCGPLVEPLETTEGNPIEISWYYGMLYEHTDEKTGEIEDRLRFVLVTPNMQTYKTASFHVAREIGRAVTTFGNVQFQPPLKMRLVKGKGRHKGEFFTLVPVLD